MILWEQRTEKARKMLDIIAASVLFFIRKLPKTVGAVRHKDKTPAEEVMISIKNDLYTSLSIERFFDFKEVSLKYLRSK